MDEAQEIRQQELARLMLQKARQDLALVRSVAQSPDVADEIVGFHAQQAIEKSIKAALTRFGIEYRYTHDLSVLYVQAEGAGITPPGSIDDVEQFTDFAVQFRWVYSKLVDVRPLRQAQGRLFGFPLSAANHRRRNHLFDHESPFARGNPKGLNRF